MNENTLNFKSVIKSVLTLHLKFRSFSFSFVSIFFTLIEQNFNLKLVQRANNRVWKLLKFSWKLSVMFSFNVGDINSKMLGWVLEVHVYITYIKVLLNFSKKQLYSNNFTNAEVGFYIFWKLIIVLINMNKFYYCSKLYIKCCT